MSPSRRRAFRLVHASDWHLGTELGTQSGAPTTRQPSGRGRPLREFRPDASSHVTCSITPAPARMTRRWRLMRCAGSAEVAPVVIVGGNRDNNVMLDPAWSMLAGLSGPGRLHASGGSCTVPSSGICRSLSTTAPDGSSSAPCPSSRRPASPALTAPGRRRSLRGRYRAGARPYGEWLEQNTDRRPTR